MKRSNRQKILCICLAAALVLASVLWIPQTARGFGDFDSRSDFGGSSSHSDYSSSGSSSDSDSGIFDLYAIFELADLLADLFGTSPAVILVIFAVIALAVMFWFRLMTASESGTRHRGTVTEKALRPGTLAKLKEADPGFSESALAERLKMLFESMQDEWEEGNIEPLRKDFLPDTWTRFNTQLQNKKAAGETAHVRNIVFEDVSLRNYTTDAEHQILTVRIVAVHNIWTTNREGRCIQGTENTRKRFTFLWTLVRPLDAVTAGGGSPEGTTHCPNCGAEVDTEAFAECPYCHTPMMKVSADWVISEIDALSQETLNK